MPRQTRAQPDDAPTPPNIHPPPGWQRAQAAADGRDARDAADVCIPQHARQGEVGQEPVHCRRGLRAHRLLSTCAPPSPTRHDLRALRDSFAPPLTLSPPPRYVFACFALSAPLLPPSPAPTIPCLGSAPPAARPPLTTHSLTAMLLGGFRPRYPRLLRLPGLPLWCKCGRGCRESGGKLTRPPRQPPGRQGCLAALGGRGRRGSARRAAAAAAAPSSWQSAAQSCDLR